VHTGVVTWVVVVVFCAAQMRVERHEALSLQLREARALWERRDVRLLADAPILMDELQGIVAGSSETSRGEAPPCLTWKVRGRKRNRKRRRRREKKELAAG
jgi:hypothetical protein